MEYFIFNNVNSNDKNIIIKEMPPIVRAKQRINTIKLEGRSGSLHEVEDNYDSYTNQIKCIIKPEADINYLKSWLKGVGKLILSTDSDVYYDVAIVNKIDFSKYLTYLKEFPLEIEFQPIAHGITIKNFSLSANTETTKNIGGNHKTYPILKCTGNGTITCNGKSILVKNNTGEIYVDCELLNAYAGNLNKNDCVEGLEDPIFLNPGDNIITVSTGLTVIVSYSEAWL